MDAAKKKGGGRGVMQCLALKVKKKSLNCLFNVKVGKNVFRLMFFMQAEVVELDGKDGKVGGEMHH